MSIVEDAKDMIKRECFRIVIHPYILCYKSELAFLERLPEEYNCRCYGSDTCPICERIKELKEALEILK